MARHVWLVRRYEPGTLADAAQAAGTAIRGGLTEAAAVCRFVGYAVEAIRQRGRRDWYYDHGGSTDAAALFAAGVRSRHRYAAGRNAGNYLLAGRRMLSQMDPAAELVPGLPVGMILDKLTEELG